MPLLKRIGFIMLIVFYIAAGVNHFIHPDGYIRIIPAYIPLHHTVNILAGLCEVVFGVMLIFRQTRPAAVWLIILMLAAFLPVHIDMLVHAPLRVGSIIVTPLIAWARLLLQPVLMYWAWWSSGINNDLVTKGFRV